MTPVFIGGAGRSGTTLAVDLLGLHPQLSPVYETDFVLKLIGLLAQRRPTQVLQGQVQALLADWAARLDDRPSEKRIHERYHHGPHYLRFSPADLAELTRTLSAALTQEACGGPSDARWRALRAGVPALFDAHAQADGKPHWVNKTPAYILLLPQLRSLWPDLRFVHCVRDGRAVAASVLTRSWGPRDAAGAARWWADRVTQGLTFEQRHPEQVFRLHYEDLLSNPLQTLTSVLTFLGADASQAPAMVERHLNAGFRFDAGRLDSWRGELTVQQVGRIHDVAGHLVDGLGYAA
jgi:hypothetical protein